MKAEFEAGVQAGRKLPPAVPEGDGELAGLRRRVAEYENAITWETSCTSCARVLDSAVSETFRREEAERRLEAADRVFRDVLEALCRRDGLPLDSTVTPGEPARNYELAERLGIGHVFGLAPDAARHDGDPAPAGGEPPAVSPAYHDWAVRELNKAIDEAALLRELAREVLREVELGTLGQHTPQATARTLARIAAWRERAGIEAGQ